jgi:predicted PurR-regulated permease PerM
MKEWEVSFRYFISAVLLVLLAALLWSMRDIFKPLLISAIAAYLLSPMVSFLVTRARMKRRVAANIVYFSALALLVVLVGLVVPVALNELQSLLSDLNTALDDLQAVLVQPIRVGGLSIYMSSLLPGLRGSFGGIIVPDSQLALQWVETGSRGFLWFLVILVTSYYLITDWDLLREWLIGSWVEHGQDELRRLYTELRAVWMGYLGGQLRLMVILMMIYTLAWAAIGLPGVLVLGPMAGLLNLLPEVGPFLAALFATVFAFIEGSNFLPISNLAFAALTLVVYFVLNNIKTIWLQPRILGQSVLLHEGLVFVAIIAAVMMWGMLGVLVVVPTLASMIVIGRYIRAKLLGLPPFPDVQSDTTLPTGK